jgi:hypothetical protein
MMVKSAQPDEGGARPPPFTLSTITSKVVVHALEDMADTLPQFLLYPYMYSVGICTLYVPMYAYGYVLCTSYTTPAGALHIFYHFWPRNLSGLITGGRCW